MGLEDFLVARMFLLTDKQGDILFSQKTAEELFGGRLSPAGICFFTPINNNNSLFVVFAAEQEQ